MFRIFVATVCAFGFALAGIQKHQLQIEVSESQPQETQSLGVVSGHGHYGGEFEEHISSNGAKQSNGAELVSLAHSSALQAKNAVQNQLTAGSQAAFGVKSSLASAALGGSVENQTNRSCSWAWPTANTYLITNRIRQSLTAILTRNGLI